MKTTLKIASVMTWFNIVFWGVIVFTSLFGLIQMPNPMSIIIFALLSAVPVNCYAALRLQASVRNPENPLSHQTPTGIRFVGIIALFMGICMLLLGTALVNDAKMVAQEMTEQIKLYPEFYKNSWFNTATDRDYKNIGFACLGLGLLIAVNVILNLRLLRWYYLIKKNDIS